MPLVLFVREAAERLEPSYAQLRRCRALCNGRPFIEKCAQEDRHDCTAASCSPHLCKPYAAPSVRSIHAILPGACSAAVRWGWISFNPMPSVRPPRKRRPQPRPPTNEQMVCIVAAAWTASSEWVSTSGCRPYWAPAGEKWSRCSGRTSTWTRTWFNNHQVNVLINVRYVPRRRRSTSACSSGASVPAAAGQQDPRLGRSARRRAAAGGRPRPPVGRLPAG